jgi:hypothetical protein
MVPTLLLMFRTFTSMLVQDDDWAKAVDGRLAKASTTNNATHRILMRMPLCGALIGRNDRIVNVFACAFLGACRCTSRLRPADMSFLQFRDLSLEIGHLRFFSIFT